ncbi:MAG: lactate utilization protein, partial [Dehalococcoidia bacterium]|nr:lactate utilization protein [Dehalococcoidia bacterium]
MSDLESRKEFFRNVRRALGRPCGGPPDLVPDATALSRDSTSVGEGAHAVMCESLDKADELMMRLETSATEAGWNVVRFGSQKEAAAHIIGLALDRAVCSIVCSSHEVLDSLQIKSAIGDAGMELTTMEIEEEAESSAHEVARHLMRAKAIKADLGLTGVDYAIAETGSCVLLARKGTSRLVSLLPPVHVAVVERGQVLLGLDELFTLRRHDFLQGDLGSYMNIISGPSRSADIEQTLVK